MLRDLVVYVMSPWNKKDFASGDFWVDYFVGIVSGKEFDMISEGTNMKYGIIRESVLFFRFKERTLTAMLELSDPDRKSTRPTHTPTATLGALGRLHLVLVSSNRP